jgi:hypothetical protein
MSVKSELQEIFQRSEKYRGEVPRYVTVRVGGDDHIPKWRSEVILPSDQVFVSDICSSKSEAEKSAAKKALASMSSSILVAIDIDSYASLLSEICEKHSNLEVVAYTSLLSPTVPPGVAVFSSKHKETFFVFDISRRVLAKKFNKVYLATRASFRDDLVEVLVESGVDAEVLTTVRQI